MSITHVKRRSGLLKGAQIDQHFDFDVFLSGVNIAAAADSVDVTTPLTTFAATGGRNGVKLPVQVAIDIDTQGFITSGICPVHVNGTNAVATDSATGNEVYGRLTEATGVYTIEFFTAPAGVEAAYELPIGDYDIMVGYRGDFRNLPPQATRSPASVKVAQDPVSVGAVTRELVVPTAVNALPALAVTPRVDTCVLNVNGQRLHVGLTPGLTITGAQITWRSKPVDFSALTAYAIGDQCYQAGVLYTATAASPAGPFVAGNWAAAPAELYVGYDVESTDFCVVEYVPG